MLTVNMFERGKLVSELQYKETWKKSLIFLSHWFEIQWILDFAFLKSFVFLIFRKKLLLKFYYLELYIPHSSMFSVILGESNSVFGHNFPYLLVEQIVLLIPFRPRFYDSLSYISFFNTYIVPIVVKAQYYHSYFRNKELETLKSQIMS